MAQRNAGFGDNRFRNNSFLGLFALRSLYKNYKVLAQVIFLTFTWVYWSVLLRFTLGLVVIKPSSVSEAMIWICTWF